MTEQGLRVLYMQYLPAGTLQEILRRIAGLSRESWNGTAFLEAVDHTPGEKAWSRPKIPDRENNCSTVPGGKSSV